MPTNVSQRAQESSKLNGLHVVPPSAPVEPAELAERLREGLRSTRAEELRAAVTENMLEGVYAVDGDGCVTFINAAATLMLGWSDEEFRGRNAHDTIHFECADGAPLSKAECRLTRARAEGLVVHAGETPSYAATARCSP